MNALKGGAFLIEEQAPDRTLTPEDFSDEIRLIAQTTEDYVNNEVLPLADRLEKLEEGLSETLLRKAGELGLLALEIPEEYGGSGLSKLAATVVAEKLAYAGGFNTSISAHTTIGTLPLVYFGNEGQKKRYLPGLATAEIIGAYALTEPEAGSDALGGRTQAVLSPDGKHYIINGTKMWITNSGFADLFTLFAKVDGEKKKFSAFLVERGLEGFSTGAEEKKMGIKASSTRQLILQDVRVPAENLLGEIGQGAKIAFNILNTGRFKLGAGCVGAAKQALEVAARYAKERVQFGQPIASFGLIQEMLAEMALRTFAVESAVYRTIGLIDDAIGEDKTAKHQLACIEEYAVECSFIKVLGSELLDFVVDCGVQIHGGYGYSQDYAIERMYRDSRINRIYEGTNEINRLLVPGMLLKRSTKGHLPLLDHAATLAQELAQLAPNFSGETLAHAGELLAHGKKLALLLLARAAKTLGNELEGEQEVLKRVADIMMGVYIAESALLRTLKLKREGKDAALFEAMTCVYADSLATQIAAAAREGFARFMKGDALQQHLAYAGRLVSRPPVDVVGLRRTIASAVLKADGYPIAW